MSWPAIQTETLPWSPAAEQLSRRAAKRQPREYQAAKVAPIGELPLEISAQTSALIEEATITAVRFDATEAHRMLPFTPLLLRSESVASSRIEQLTSSARKVLEAEMTGNTEGNAGLIAANTRQMAEAVESGEPTVKSILQMHRVLLEHSAPAIAGQLRQQQVWIGGGDLHPGDAAFVPPHHRHLNDAMGDLERFMQRTDLPALAQAALAHAQFETIHPFADGNGRTGRALIHVILRARKVATAAALPISVGLLADTAGYFDTLSAYRRGEVEPVIRLLAQSTITAAQRGTWLARELTAVREEWNSLVTARAGALAWQVLDILPQRPILTAAVVAQQCAVSAETARNALDRLEADGIVFSAQLDRRRRAWRSPDVLELLDEFAASGRRTSTSELR